MGITASAGVAVVEDCAHTMGAHWNGVPSGQHGLVACYSTQTYKHINSGEGGFIVTRDAEIMARATVLSGSYMLYERHLAVPESSVFEQIRLDTPNCSGRMDNLRAAILRPQLRALDVSVSAWNERYRELERRLSKVQGLRLTHRPDEEHYVGSSIQFYLEGLSDDEVDGYLSACAERGVELKWFGREEPTAYTSRYDSWQYVDKQSLPGTDAALARLFDMRIPLTFSVEDCGQIAEIIGDCLRLASGDAV
jgi:dTDP-4-amino-4,6-dideoxygalactose transaminase